MKQFHQRLCGLCFAVAIAATACSQRVSFKTNALYWGTLSPNAGVEFRLSRHFTLNLEGAVNPFTIGDYKLHSAAFMPEARYCFQPVRRLDISWDSWASAVSTVWLGTTPTTWAMPSAEV